MGFIHIQNSNLSYKELVTGDDLNTTLGHYRTVQTAIIKSLVNRPAGLDKGGEITVDWYPAIFDNSYGTQIIRQAHAGMTYIHARSKIGLTSWGTWDTFIKNADMVYYINGVKAGKVIWYYETDNTGPFLRLTVDNKNIAFFRVSGTYSK